MSDDDLPVMAESDATRKKLVSRARAILKKAAEGKTLWDVVDEYTLDALVELRAALDAPDPKIRFIAADRLAGVWTKMPPRPGALVTANVAPEQRREVVRAALRDDEVRRIALEEGWTPPRELTATAPKD